jgi:glyceraldehyde-3-phosphate dehydrogenase/erythrose-4-phosphate dehydrogenase
MAWAQGMAADAAALLCCCVARSALMNLAPTSTGSATAIALIFPELKGKLNGLAVRVPLTNSSITDCVFEVRRPRIHPAVAGCCM